MSAELDLTEWTEWGVKGDQQIKTLENFHLVLTVVLCSFTTSSPFFFLLTTGENEAHLGSPPSTTSFSSSSSFSLAGTVGTTGDTEN